MKTQFLIAWLSPYRSGLVGTLTRGLSRYSSRESAEKQIARFRVYFPANRYYLEVVA